MILEGKACHPLVIPLVRCAPGCLRAWEGDKVCDDKCNNPACHYDAAVAVSGCTHVMALNFNQLATFNNGTNASTANTGTNTNGCEYSKKHLNNPDASWGCTHPQADNYKFIATLDDGSCEYVKRSHLVVLNSGRVELATVSPCKKQCAAGCDTRWPGMQKKQGRGP